MTRDISLQTGWSNTEREKNKRKENISEDCLQTETNNTELHSSNKLVMSTLNNLNLEER